MVIGIKYCGGCNPVYDRGKRARSFMEENPGHEYVASDMTRVCDIWMVVCGCTRRCVDTSGLKAHEKIVMVWDEESYRRLEQEIRGRELESGGGESRGQESSGKESLGQESSDGQNLELEIGNEGILQENTGKRQLCLHDKAVSSRVMTMKDILSFTGLTGDESGLHRDSDMLLRAGFDRPLVPGMFLDSLVSAIMGTELPGSGTVYMEHTTRWIRPVFSGDTVEITVEFVSCQERVDCYVGIFRGTARNQKGERVLTATCAQMMKKSLFKVAGIS